MKRWLLALNTRERVFVTVLVLAMAILAVGLWYGFAPREEARVVYLRWFEGNVMLVGEDKQDVYLSEKETLFWARVLDTYRGLDGLIVPAEAMLYDENYWWYQPDEDGIYWIVTYRGSLFTEWEPVDISPFIVPPEERLHLRYFRWYDDPSRPFIIKRYDGRCVEHNITILDGPASAFISSRYFGDGWAVFRFDGPKILYPVYPQ